MIPQQPKSLEGRVLSLTELKKMKFEETDRSQDNRFHWYSRNGQQEEVIVIKLLAYKESFQIISHYIK